MVGMKYIPTAVQRYNFILVLIVKIAQNVATLCKICL